MANGHLISFIISSLSISQQWNNILNTFVTIATTIKNTRWSNDFMYELILWPFRCPVNYEFRGQQIPSYAHKSGPLVRTITQPNLPSPPLTEISVPISCRTHSRKGKRMPENTLDTSLWNWIANGTCVVTPKSCDSSRRNIIVDRQHFLWDKILNTDLALSNMITH